MNILASYKWLKEYLKTDLTPEEFARELSLKSMSVESIDKGAEKFAGMVVGVIKEVKPHPKADRLRITVVDVGAQTVEIVCGGSNLEVDQKVFVA
ncbi:MAG TPA: phenylalanine--tRNA ligase subunit beta, partial [bacterium]|nr:phenylalanine--tRNA ligase subunit beta [bacterium]